MFTRLPLLLIFFIGISTAGFAETDPMTSLFHFQQKMANNGQASAMMKVGEMYERGEGVKQSDVKALEMFRKANIAGHAKAKAAIQRIQNKKNSSVKKKNKILKEKQQRALAQERAQKQRKAKIAKERAAKINAEKARARAAKARAAKIRAEKAKVAKAKAAKISAEKTKAAKTKAAKISAEKAKAAKADAAKEEFKADPCKGKAARLLSTCR